MQVFLVHESELQFDVNELDADNEAVYEREHDQHEMAGVDFEFDLAANVGGRQVLDFVVVFELKTNQRHEEGKQVQNDEIRKGLLDFPVGAFDYLVLLKILAFFEIFRTIFVKHLSLKIIYLKKI